MAGLEVKSVGSPEETRPFQDGKGNAAVVNVGGQPILYATFEPGWRWSEHVKPIAGTDSCQTNHLGYVLSGRMIVRAADGSETEVAAGDVFYVGPGHDAWAVGDEQCVALDFAAR